MRQINFLLFISIFASPALGGDFKVSRESVSPGSGVLAGGKKLELYPASVKLEVGTKLQDAIKGFDFGLKGKVAVISIVPSIDTPVCEEQTHLLGESSKLADTVDRITISRDLPMAQSRFSREAKLTNIRYLSDYKNGEFGHSSGLMIKELELLARGVIVVDQSGVIRYMQLVPDTGTLPDMEKAIDVANSLAGKKP